MIFETYVHLCWRELHEDDRGRGDHGCDRGDHDCDRGDHDYGLVCDGYDRDRGQSGRGGYGLPELLTLVLVEVLFLVEVLNVFFFQIVIIII